MLSVKRYGFYSPMICLGLQCHLLEGIVFCFSF